ncbi:transcriptional regulator [Sulfodiicoccus acidiphilus]|uniref:Putative HTH-type transcriptional regulatory protein GCM10007116_11620 n=1 Tax=Sulfodiicoccus acidiphilus TaxID=1670455 RepID=A0A348B3A1_9CREN|nr:helix-turn-helix domain-containing protein [Sulfodiicoccus acidiphilus]BBD72653.1 transcriptional regulator [Sulfodiicoccus acidiphilus]GGT95678.1 transcriptional regulator [Sulfodiicoccus acidiphilus]
MVLDPTEVLRTIERKGSSGFLLNYPEEGRRRSIDIMARKGSRLLLIKLAQDRVGKQEVADLKNFSSVMGATPLLLTEEAEDEMAVIREGLVGVSKEGLERILEDDKIPVFKTKGGIFVKVNSERIREERERLGYSIGDLAKYLGVSRKAVYEYERGLSAVSIQIAEKLVGLLGEEVIGDLLSDYKIEPAGDFPSNLLKSKILKIARDSGYSAAELQMTAADVVAAKGEARFIVTIESKNVEQKSAKLKEVTKMRGGLGSKLVLITRTHRFTKDVDGEDVEVLLEEEVDRLKEILNEPSGG